MVCDIFFLFYEKKSILFIVCTRKWIEASLLPGSSVSKNGNNSSPDLFWLDVWNLEPVHSESDFPAQIANNTSLAERRRPCNSETRGESVPEWFGFWKTKTNKIAYIVACCVTFAFELGTEYFSCLWQGASHSVGNRKKTAISLSEFPTPATSAPKIESNFLRMVHLLQASTSVTYCLRIVLWNCAR